MPCPYRPNSREPARWKSRGSAAGRRLTCGGGAGESGAGHDFFGLEAVAFAMRAKEQEPLVAIAWAENRVRKSVLAELALEIGGEIGGTLANGFEFREELGMRPARGGHEALRAFHAGLAIHHPTQH